MRHGFTLVEVAIVLVILGLLTGGILAGQSLIRASELRSVSTEQLRYDSAATAFRDRYLVAPGDFRDATKYWGLQVVHSLCVSNSGISAASSPGTCDGNGDGMLAAAGAVSQSGEFAQFWRHLALAGLIEGTYTGLAGSGGLVHSTADNAPRSKLSNGYWGIQRWGGPLTGTASFFNGTYENCLVFGGLHATESPATPILKPEEAWNIDTKLDDGKPGTGKMNVRARVLCAVAADGSALTTSAADAAKLDSRYNLALATAVCVPVFCNNF